MNLSRIGFRNLNTESLGITLYVASFTWPPISPLIKLHDITKEVQPWRYNTSMVQQDYSIPQHF